MKRFLIFLGKFFGVVSRWVGSFFDSLSNEDDEERWNRRN